MLTNFLAKLKQPQVLSFIALIIIQIGARYGLVFDSAAVQGNVLSAIDALTWLNGIIIAHKSEQGSIL